MDMKKILQAIDNASTEVSSSEMQRLRNIVEGKGPLNRSTPAESIAMQHYAEPKKTITAPVLNVQEGAVPSMIGKYFKAIEEELQESAHRGNLRARQLAERVSTKINELSTDSLAAYKKAAGADAKKADAEGDFDRGNKRFKGINKATIKQFDNDAKKHKQQEVAEDSDPCWDSHKMVGTKKKGGKTVPNCVPKESVKEDTKRCMQCGMTNCTCAPGKCKCKPVAGWIPNKGFKKAVDEAANLAQQAAIAIAKKKAGKK
jgi:hypothetical protein